jgi:hypothetical protein
MDGNSLPIAEIWVYLSGTPRFLLVLTLSAYQAGVMVCHRSNKNPIANPVIYRRELFRVWRWVYTEFWAHF